MPDDFTPSLFSKKVIVVCHDRDSVFYVLNVFAGHKQSSPTVEHSSPGNERDTISPTPMMGSNKLGMASGWSSEFETQAAVDTEDSTANEADHVGPLPGLREPLSQVTHTKLQNVPSFGTLLRDYSVQGRNRFEAPAYAGGTLPLPLVAQQVENDVILILIFSGKISKQASLITHCQVY